MGRPARSAGADHSILAWRDDNGEYRDLMVDSRRRSRCSRRRSLVAAWRRRPGDGIPRLPAEDFGDEWVSKMMYHWRWANDVDAVKSGRILPLDRGLQIPDEYAAKAHEMFVSRQVSRRGLIGSSDNNAPVIEASYERTLDLLEAHLAHQDFFGDRPGRSDFAVFGQLLPMLWWIRRRQPLGSTGRRAPCGFSGWTTCPGGESRTKQPGGTRPTRSPTRRGRSSLRQGGCMCRSWSPTPRRLRTVLTRWFVRSTTSPSGRSLGYQECVQWIRDAYNALATVDRDRVGGIEGTGCEVLVHTRTI